MSYKYENNKPVYHCEIGVDEKLNLLKQMSGDGRISADHFSIKNDRIIMVLDDDEINLLQKNGFKIKRGENILERIDQIKDKVVESHPLIERDGLVSGFVTKYMDAKQVIDKFKSLHNEFSDITQIIDLPYKTFGYDGKEINLRGPSSVKLFRINNNPNKLKPGMLLISGTHAREWVPPLSSIEFVEQLLRSYSPLSSTNSENTNKILEGLDIFIIPILNPDGVNYSHHDKLNWRKNRNPNTSTSAFNCKGVDINRNYSIYWGELGSTDDICNDSYHGISPISEPENQNVVYILNKFTNIKTAVDCHSYGEDIFRPHPTGGIHITSQPVTQGDDTIYTNLESSMNLAISSISHGKQYSTGTTNNHAGTSDDYFYFAHRIFGFCLECGHEDLDFWPPIEEAIKITKEVSAALRAVAERTLILNKNF